MSNVIEFLKVDENSDIILPERSTENSAGYDFLAPYDFDVLPGEQTDIIWTGVKACMFDNMYLEIKNRSSLCKKKVFLACSGIIDSDYVNNEKTNGNIGVAFENRSDKVYHFKKGDKMCQGIFGIYFITHNDNAKSKRTGGFGSTGK